MGLLQGLDNKLQPASEELQLLDGKEWKQLSQLNSSPPCERRNGRRGAETMTVRNEAKSYMRRGRQESSTVSLW